MYVWDEKKRLANLAKHRLDFADAYVVYENPTKATFLAIRSDERRSVDVAMVMHLGTMLSLVYVIRDGDVRVISFRNASRKERRFYAETNQSN